MSLREYTSQARTRFRGLANPALIRAFGPRDYDLRQSLVISGFPRSGTTWLAEVVATLPGFGIIFEPLNIDTVPGARAAGFDRDNFRVPGEAWPEGEAFLRTVLEGRLLTRWTTSDLPIPRAFSVRRWVIKFVRANQMLAWMTERFPLVPPLLLIRHPCAVHASWIERGWPVLQSAHHNARFMAAYPEFEPVISRLRTPEEFLAARWCQAHYHTMRTPKPWPFSVAFYDRLIANAGGELERIMDRWGLRLPEETLSAVSRPSAKASGQLSSDAPSQSGGWRKRLDPGVVGRILDVVAAFGLDFYDTSPAAHLDHPLLAMEGRE